MFKFTCDVVVKLCRILKTEKSELISCIRTWLIPIHNPVGNDRKASNAFFLV